MNNLNNMNFIARYNGRSFLVEYTHGVGCAPQPSCSIREVTADHPLPPWAVDYPIRHTRCVGRGQLFETTDLASMPVA